MRAFVLTRLDDPPGLRDDLPEPTPADDQVLVPVSACSAYLPHADPTVHDGTWTELIVVPELRCVVPAPALPEDAEYLRSHGASEVLDRDADAVAVRARAIPTASTPSSTSSPASYGLDRAGEALRALGAEHTQGKLAIQVA